MYLNLKVALNRGLRKERIDPMKTGQPPYNDNGRKRYFQAMGTAIWFLRKRHGISRAELAQRANICLSYLAHIESNNGDPPVSPSLDVLLSIAEGIGVELATILMCADEMKSL